MHITEKIAKVREYAARHLRRAEREMHRGNSEKASVLRKDARRLKKWADSAEQHFQVCE